MRRLKLWLLGLLLLPGLAAAGLIILSGGPGLGGGGGSITLGAHSKRVDIDGLGTSPATATINSATSGSSFLYFRGGEFGDNSSPTDNKGNTLTQRGSNQGYGGGLWPGFGIQLWTIVSGAGGTTHTVSNTKSHTDREISIAWIEVQGATSIVSSAQSSSTPQGAGVGTAGPSVTTTGPGYLCSMWSGDGDAATSNQTVAVNSPWSLVEFSFQAATPYVQFAVACRSVSGAGTYFPTWTPVVNQGFASITVAMQ